MSVPTLFHAGPLFELERRVPVPRARSELVGHSVLFLLLGWVPVVALALVEHAVGLDAADVLLRLELHARWFIGVPSLFVGERRMDDRIRYSLTYLITTGIVAAEDRPRLARAEELVDRWIDSRALELVLLLAAVLMSVPELPPAERASEIWVLAISLPLFRFLLMRFLVRWCLWSYLLVRISRFDLQLMGTHPDRNGGLAVLVEASRGMAPIGFGVMAVSASAWATQVSRGDALVTDFAQPIALLFGMVLILAFVPLLPFGASIRRTRTRFVHEYAALVHLLAERFHERWIRPNPPDPLGHPDMSSFIDLDSVFEHVHETSILIVSRRAALSVAVWTLLPAVPLYLMSVPLADALQKIVSVLV